MNWILRFLINAIVFYLIAKYVPGFYHNPGIWSAIGAAVVFGLVNMFIGPVLRLISLPLTIVTLGVFALIVNYILFAITVHFANLYDPSSGVNPWLADLYGAIIMMIVSAFTHLGAESEARRKV